MVNPRGDSPYIFYGKSLPEAVLGFHTKILGLNLGSETSTLACSMNWKI